MGDLPVPSTPAHPSFIGIAPYLCSYSSQTARDGGTFGTSTTFETMQGAVLLLLVLQAACAAAAASRGNGSCVRSCGGVEVPYPFGFSGTCTIPLSCSSSGGNIAMWLGNTPELGLVVRSITPRSLVLVLRPNCSRPVNESVAALFSNTSAPTSANALLLRSCRGGGGRCSISTDALVDSPHCAANDSVRCLLPANSSVGFLKKADVLGSGCDALVTAASYARDSGALLLNALELEWWVEGDCRCSSHANCSAFAAPTTGRRAFRCGCPEGFEGDGFADGTACRRVPKCNPSKYLSGACGRIVQIGLLMAGIILGAAMMGVSCVVCHLLKRRSASLKKQRSTRRLLSEASCTVPLYSYREIERATDGFSDDQRLGTGAYGTVYAGRLSNSRLVAVKRIKQREYGGLDQVMNEVKLLSSVSHPNLVRLLGCCIERGQQILVYEFMPNGTLAQHLQRERGPAVPWTVRLRIAAETARAVAYLHSEVCPPIYHRDIKSSNILLDFEYNSKVADFGLSRMAMTSVDSSHISTAPQGTPGYLDPQYHQNFHLSDKSDVYSFGVVLVEIITAMKAVDFSRVPDEVKLAQLAVDKIGRGQVDDIVDPYLEPHRDAWTLTSIHKVAELAFRCLAFHSEMRPSMAEVADELEQIQVSGWAPSVDDVQFMSTTSSLCSSAPSRCTEKSWAASRSRMAPEPVLVNAAVVEEREKGAVDSPVSVQDRWFSERSSPSSNSLLGNHSLH